MLFGQTTYWYLHTQAQCFKCIMNRNGRFSFPPFPSIHSVKIYGLCWCYCTIYPCLFVHVTFLSKWIHTLAFSFSLCASSSSSSFEKQCVYTMQELCKHFSFHAYLSFFVYDAKKLLTHIHIQDHVCWRMFLCSSKMNCRVKLHSNETYSKRCIGNRGTLSIYLLSILVS